MITTAQVQRHAGDGIVDNVNTRSVILKRAAELLAQSPNGDISTRTVCEAAGVGQPALYRLFGDKAGLLAAVADEVWGDYLSAKRTVTPSDDPLEDLRRGWDNHTAFALANPHAYRLLFGTALSTKPEGAAEAMRLLQSILDRVASSGRLRVDPADAARVVMAANTGVALALILRPDSYPDLAISVTTREATLGGLLAAGPVAKGEASTVAATTLRAELEESTVFTAAENALLREWLGRIQQGSDHRSAPQID